MNRFEKPTITISMFSQVIGTADDPTAVSGIQQGTVPAVFDETTVTKIHRISYQTFGFKE